MIYDKWVHYASPENDDLYYGCTYNYEMKKWFSLFKFRKNNDILDQSIENQIYHLLKDHH